MSCSGKSFDFVNLLSTGGFSSWTSIFKKKKEDMFVTRGVAPCWALKKG